MTIREEARQQKSHRFLRWRDDLPERNRFGLLADIVADASMNSTC